jgi:hypothetical protein
MRVDFKEDGYKVVLIAVLRWERAQRQAVDAALHRLEDGAGCVVVFSAHTEVNLSNKTIRILIARTVKR